MQVQVLFKVLGYKYKYFQLTQIGIAVTLHSFTMFIKKFLKKNLFLIRKFYARHILSIFKANDLNSTWAQNIEIPYTMNFDDYYCNLVIKFDVRIVNKTNYTNFMISFNYVLLLNLISCRQGLNMFLKPFTLLNHFKNEL